MPALHRTIWENALACVARGDVPGLLETLGPREGLLAEERPLPDAGEPYGRRQLFGDARGEVMIAAWREGVACAPHDHGDAHGMVLALRGRFTETVHAFASGTLVPVAARPVEAGAVLLVESGAIHAMHSHDHGITLHFYVPRIEEMRVFDARARTTLIVADECGAWVPRDASLVLRRTPWAPATTSTLTARE